MGEGERSLCLQGGGCRDSDGTPTSMLHHKEQHMGKDHLQIRRTEQMG